MKYLVTGAAGFIGSAIADKLISQGHEVHVIDNLQTGYIASVPEKAIFRVTLHICTESGINLK